MKIAAVLILVYNRSIVFIKRNKKLKVHPGEISFPGGIFEPKDKHLLNTALRETFEEIGIDPVCIKIIGKMKTFETLVTRIKVTPFIGISKEKKLNFFINKKEVEDILIIPILHLLDNKNKVIVPLKFNDKIYYNTFYYYNNNLIWGATSRILDEFLKDKNTLNQFNN